MHRKDNVYIFQGPEVFELVMQVFAIPSGAKMLTDCFTL